LTRLQYSEDVGPLAAGLQRLVVGTPSVRCRRADSGPTVNRRANLQRPVSASRRRTAIAPLTFCLLGIYRCEQSIRPCAGPVTPMKRLNDVLRRAKRRAVFTGSACTLSNYNETSEVKPPSSPVAPHPPPDNAGVRTYAHKTNAHKIIDHRTNAHNTI